MTKDYGYGPLNVFAFYQPRFKGRGERTRDIGYYATTLPITPALRRQGHQRWGIEGGFKDFKSAGWQVHESALRDAKRREGLMVILSLAYVWATGIGRWLCKVGKRQLVDSKQQRHLSLFRIGWDWLVHQYVMDLSCPALLTLYQ